MPTSEPVKIGILSTANIARTFLEALKLVPEAGICMAVASRSVEKARKFAKESGIPTACTYEELLKKEVEAIYIPLPTALSTDWAVRIAENGIHVLVDKPFASADDVQRIIDACEKSGTIFMDGTHFVHSSRTRLVADKIRNGEIGDVRRVDSSFCVPLGLDGNIRSDPSLEPMGAAGDLGWYVMRSAIAYLGMDKTAIVKSVLSTGKVHPEYNIVEAMEGTVVFESSDSNRIVLSFSIDAVCTFSQNVCIKGTTGMIDISGFVIPDRQTDVFEEVRKPEDYSTDTEIITTSTVSHFETSGNPVIKFPVKERVLVKEEQGLTQPAMMVKEFCRMIRENDLEKSRQWSAQSLQTQKLVDTAFEQVVA